MWAHDTDEINPNHMRCMLMIMTSNVNHSETVEFFKKNNYFGAPKERILFFPQATLPAVGDQNGKIIMKSPSEMLLSPNGNGALFESVNTNPEVDNYIGMTDFVQIIGVDNVMNRILDPVQVYFTWKNQLECSLKCLVKRDPEEPVGVLCRKNGKYDIVEYSEIPKDVAARRVPGSN